MPRNRIPQFGSRSHKQWNNLGNNMLLKLSSYSLLWSKFTGEIRFSKSEQEFSERFVISN